MRRVDCTRWTSESAQPCAYSTHGTAIVAPIFDLAVPSSGMHVAFELCVTVKGSVTIWKSQGVRCVLVPQPDWGYFQLHLIRGNQILEMQAVKTLDDAYPIARRWQLEGRSPSGSASAAA